MVDALGPLRPLSGSQGIERYQEMGAARPAHAGEPGGFKDVFSKSMQEVNQLQKEADQAIQDLAVGKRDDYSGVITAVQKADVAFRTLMQVRNKLIDAYQEFQRMRV
jgi:flagellar hook-basal body complex protein FliE